MTMNTPAAYAAVQKPLVVAEARKREAEDYFKRQQWSAAACAFGDALELANASSETSEKATALRVAISLNLALAALRSGDAAKAEGACLLPPRALGVFFLSFFLSFCLSVFPGVSRRALGV